MELGAEQALMKPSHLSNAANLPQIFQKILPFISVALINNLTGFTQHTTHYHRYSGIDSLNKKLSANL